MFFGYGSAVAHEFLAAVTACIKPALDQASQNFSMDWRETHELSSLPEELLSGDDGCGGRESQFFFFWCIAYTPVHSPISTCIGQN